MKFNSDPPVPKFISEFPHIDRVVTVANCWYYLSLLERFVDITQSMTEDVLKMFLVRAEYRYFQFVTKSLKAGRNVKLSVPPVGKKN
jgi:hypothetical protein